MKKKKILRILFVLLVVIVNLIVFWKIGYLGLKKQIVICGIIDVIAVYVLRHFFSLIDIPVEIYQNRRLAFSLAKNDFKTKYAGSYLGMVWAFIQPIVTIAVYRLVS